ncbi:hypothetical protein CVIRNUC_010217 [Coccomyxa viridis]|uniref:Uncharacterized protein n=1 Tax=Coccomyxa viridis TaxID=1274662 RepID=A0AAV1IJK4_9CHLO|nr:hypothetical protein CVIRNUC_010217 [Coccomyxa viridis]
MGIQELVKQDGKQARLQLEDMLTRIEMHFQAEKSARMEAEARCAAALAALRQARGLPGRAGAQAAEKGAPQGALEMARDGLTAARDLATSLCTILDEVEVVRRGAHQLCARMDSLLQELPPAAAGDANVTGYESYEFDEDGGPRFIADLRQSQSDTHAMPHSIREAQGLRTDGAWRGPAESPSSAEQSGLQAAHSVIENKYSQHAMANGRFMQATREHPGRGAPQRHSRTLSVASGHQGTLGQARQSLARMRTAGRIVPSASITSSQQSQQQRPQGNASLPGQRQRSLSPEAKSGASLDYMPPRIKPEQPQRWETSTKFMTAAR